MSPMDRIQTFLLQMWEWEVNFHAEKSSDAYKQDPNYRDQADRNAKFKLKTIFSENLSMKAFNDLGTARLDTLGTGVPPEYGQAVLADTESRSGSATNIEAVRQKGLKQRYRYTVIIEHDLPKIDDVYIWRGSSGRWERRHAL
ncbi:RhsIA family immunity protein [Trinickia sp. LjRoot230]|uniref:NTF2 fold immunity protein n=1 Tax=Trinickia sp. LjRoot230 TaxID=3342288 RepID=UPI003ECC875D